MKLRQLKIRNFRSYRKEVALELDNLVVLVGKNDAGKSTAFDALDIFFGNKSTPDRDDPSVHSGDTTVSITCSFSDLPTDVVIDVQHTTDLASEHLLNSDGQLEITKTFECGLQRPKLSETLARAVHPTAEHYSDLLTLNNNQLKQRARSLGVELDDVNQSINSQLRKAIWAHAGDLKMQEIPVPIKGDAESIWSQLSKALPVFALFKADRPSTDQDSEAQDPMKAAVKVAIQAQQEALEEIANKVRAEVQETADRTVAKIMEMDPTLGNQLTPQVTTKSWDSLFSVNLTGDQDIPINKRGSGTRRLVLLNFFRAQAEREAEETGNGVIYAIEEPETSQHPHNQLMLVGACQELVDRLGCQVFVSTHNPILARRFDQNALRLVTQDVGQTTIRYGREDDTVRAIVASLGILPDHGVRAFLGLEGKHDIAFLRSISAMLHQVEEDIPDLAREEDEGRLVVVPLGGSNLDLWVSRLQRFNRPEFYMTDRDYPPPCQPKYLDFIEQVNQRENCTGWYTDKKEMENYIHPRVIASILPNYCGNGDPFEDVPELVARAIHEDSESTVAWNSLEEDKRGKKISQAKRRLNDEMAAQMTPELLTEIDPQDEVRKWLRMIGSALDGAAT